jgi:hypothetical protein
MLALVVSIGNWSCCCLSNPFLHLEENPIEEYQDTQPRIVRVNFERLVEDELARLIQLRQNGRCKDCDLSVELYTNRVIY